MLFNLPVQQFPDFLARSGGGDITDGSVVSQNIILGSDHFSVYWEYAEPLSRYAMSEVRSKAWMVSVDAHSFTWGKKALKITCSVTLTC